MVKTTVSVIKKHVGLNFLKSQNYVNHQFSLIIFLTASLIINQVFASTLTSDDKVSKSQATAQSTSSQSSSIAATTNPSKAAIGTQSIVTNEVSTNDTQKNNEKKASAVLSLNYTRNFFDKSDINTIEVVTYGLSPSYSLTESTKVSSKILIEQSLHEENNTKINSIPIAIGTTLVKFENKSSVTGSLALGLPTNTIDNEKSSFRTSLSTGLGLTTPFVIGTLPFKFLGNLNLNKNFHEYNLNSSRGKNKEFNFAMGSSLGADLTDRVSLSISLNYLIQQDYEKQQNYAYKTGLGIDFAATDKLSLGLSLENGGNALKANGVDSNINFTDENSASVTSSLGYVF